MQGMGYGMGTMGFFFWVTTLLVWTVLILTIIALYKWINKK